MKICINWKFKYNCGFFEENWELNFSAVAFFFFHTISLPFFLSPSSSFLFRTSLLISFFFSIIFFLFRKIEMERNEMKEKKELLKERRTYNIRNGEKKKHRKITTSPHNFFLILKNIKIYCCCCCVFLLRSWSGVEWTLARSKFWVEMRFFEGLKSEMGWISRV